MSKAKEVIVIGAGGHAAVVIATLKDAKRKVALAIDDDEDRWDDDILGVPITGPISWAKQFEDCEAVIGIGDNAAREKLAKSLGLTWTKAVHSKAHVHSSVVVANGAVVFCGAIVQPRVAIGPHAILNTACTVDHDCIIQDFAQIAPGAHIGGNVKVGKGAFIGIGASIAHGIEIGEGSVIGAGAAVIKNVPPGVLVAGVPAVIKKTY